MGTFTFTETMTILHCANCSIRFGMPPDFEQRRRKDHKGFFCPAGHSNVYEAESDEEKAIRERNVARQQRARVEDEKRAALREAERAKAETRKLKKRASAGTCPCCHRTVAQMARHMKTKHPEFVAQETTNIVRMKATK